MLRILAGGGFTSRLMQSVREQRGLAYGIGAGLDLLFRHGVIVGSVATENARVAETLAVTREEWARMAEGGPTMPRWPMPSPSSLARCRCNSPIAGGSPRRC